jgi:hypothetical protein
MDKYFYIITIEYGIEYKRTITNYGLLEADSQAPPDAIFAEVLTSCRRENNLAACVIFYHIEKM